MKPQNVLELGCGSGRLSFHLVSNLGVENVTGVDISEQAIALARKHADEKGMSDRLTFLESQIADLDFEALRPFDLVLGMGLIQYLLEAELAHLFQPIENSLFLFDVHAKGLTFFNLSHAVYRKIKGHPFYHLYGKEEMLAKLADTGYSTVLWKQFCELTYITDAIAVDEKTPTQSA